MRQTKKFSNEKISGCPLVSPSKRIPLAPSPDTAVPLSTKSRAIGGVPKIEKPDISSNVSHFTIRSKVKLTEKIVRLLLEVEAIRVCQEGFSIQDYFSFNWMVEYLRGDHDPIDNNSSSKTNFSVRLARIILLSFKGKWNLLLEKNPLDPRIVKWIEDNLLDKNSSRTYQSRKQYYQLSKFLEFRIVTVEDLIERSGNSIRYTSYCKGYGESGRSVRHQRTRFSYELDRDDSPENLPEEIFSSDKYQHYQEDLFYLEEEIQENS